jgi:stage V sporulation protein B
MAGIIVRIIGMFYRIPLMNIIGSEGNGVYSVAYNIYNIMLVLSSYGLPMAVSKLISARFAKRQYRNAGQIYRSSLLISLCTGGAAALILFFGAGVIENIYKSVTGLAIPLRVLAPTILFVAVMGVVRGFFQGQGTMIPTAVSQLIEQIVNAVVSITAGYLLMKAFADSEHVAAYGAAGGTMGTAAGAFAGLVFLVAIYIIYRPVFARMMRNDRTSENLASGEVYKTIIFTMLPIIIGQTLYNVSAVIDDAMYSNMQAVRDTASTIKTDLGNFASSYSLLISIPQGVASAMSASMLPSVVTSFTEKKYRDVRSKINSTLKTNMFIAVPSFVGLTVLGEPVIKLLFSRYNSAQGAMMLKIGAIAVVFYTLSTVTSSALQGINRMNVPVKHSFIALVVHIILVFSLLKWSRLGIYAIVIGNASFPLLILILNLMSLRKYVRFRMNYRGVFMVPVICSVFMGVVTWLVYAAMYALTKSNTVSVIIALAAALVSYFVPVMLFKKKGLY